MNTEEYTIYDIGFDSFISRATSFEEVDGFAMPSVMTSEFFGAVNPSVLASGETVNALTMVIGSYQSASFITGVSGWQMLAGGDVEFNSGIFRGSLIAGELHIPDEDTTANSFHINSTGDAWWGATESDFNSDNDNATAYVLKTGAAKFQSIILSGSVVITGIQIGSEISIQGWQLDTVFSATDENTVAWAAGTLTLMSGATYSIGGGNTGNMSARTYIYLDIAISTTAFQTTTTATTAVGSGKILVAVAEDNSGSDATFQVFGGIGGGLWTTANIATNTITANEIAANTITASEMNVSVLSAISANIGTITSGTITGLTIRTAATGQRIIMEGSDNSLRFFDSSAQVIGMGTTAGTGLVFSLNAVTTKAIQVVGGNVASTVGFDYSNSNNVLNRGLQISMTGIANNTASALNIINAGSGELLFGDVQGTGFGLFISRSSGSGTAALLKLLNSVVTSSQILLIQNTAATGVGIMVEIVNDAQGIAFQLEGSNAAISLPTFKLISATLGSSLLIDKNNSGQAIEIDQDANDGNNTIGIKMNIANAGGGPEYAFELQGSEYDASKTGVSGLTGVIKILTATDGAVFIPVYSSAS